MRRKIKLEKDLKNVSIELEDRTRDVKEKEFQLHTAEEDYMRCEQQLRETRVSWSYQTTTATTTTAFSKCFLK